MLHQVLSQEKDSLHILPLRLLPLKTAALSDARIIKNSNLDGVVELFSRSGSGSGQVYPEDLKEFFDLRGESEQDYWLIYKLSALPSYDMYSVRMALREIGMPESAHRQFSLTPDKVAELSNYMNLFTRPLIASIYGEEFTANRSFNDILKLFMQPDIPSAKRNLCKLADALDVELSEIPRFLEIYGDVYLSLAYYSQCMASISPSLRGMIDKINLLRMSAQFKRNPVFQNTCELIEKRICTAEASILEILTLFRDRTEAMWLDMDSTRFQDMCNLIISLQRDIGGTICALTVKANSWEQLKGKRNPMICGAFIMSDLAKGIENVVDVKISDFMFKI